jgi:serine/threonine-protein kinase
MEKRWLWPFELEEQIGSGAMGLVYRARFVKNDRRVALKLLPADVAANPTLAARFQREMELLKDLRHPHIVHCFGGTCEGDQWFYAMELVDGGTLASLIQEQGRLPWRRAVEFTQQVCAALAYAHERDIIHRDLKPGNLLITKTGKLKLSDFGLAQMVAETRLTAAGKTVGSLHYMSPEQIQGKPPLSNRSDLYGLGCVLYEMLTGRPPFLGGTMAEVLQRHVRDTPQPIVSIAFDCPPQLEELVSELLAKDPSKRPGDAQIVARRLREVDQSVTVKVPRFDRNKPTPKALGTETLSAEIRRPAWSIGPWLATGLLVIGVAIGWMASTFQSKPPPSAGSARQLIAGLRDPRPDVRVFAAHALGEIGPDAHDAVPALIEALDDGNPFVRAEAARALSKTATSDEALPELRKLQQRDENSTVRDVASEAQKLLRQSPEESSSVWPVFGLAALGLAAGAGTCAWWFLRKSPAN